MLYSYCFLGGVGKGKEYYIILVLLEYVNGLVVKNVNKYVIFINFVCL